MGGGGHPLDFLLTITPVRRLLITNCLLCRGEEWWAHPCARIPIFGWSDRNFRCIIYSRFNEPRKRSKGPRGLFLIIRRTREGRVSRSPSPLFPCAPSLPPLLPHPPLHLLVPRFQCRTVFYPSSLLRFLRPPPPSATSSSIDDTLLPGCWCSSSRLEFLSPSFFRRGRNEKIDMFDTNRTQEWYDPKSFRERCRKDLTDGYLILKKGMVD